MSKRQTPRPPKPPGIIGSPRHIPKGPTKPQNVGKNCFARLAELANGPADYKHFEAYIAQTSGESNHRGAAILMAANVEVGLDTALRRIISRGRADMQFGTDKPLGTFRNKIWLAYGLALYGDQTFITLEAIRHIRNAFAHAQIPISFDAPEVMAVCDLLVLQPNRPPVTVGANDKDVAGLKGLARYREACTRIGHNLHVLNLGGQHFIAPEALGNLIPSDIGYIVARQEPLP